MTAASEGRPRILLDVDVILDVLARRAPFFTDSCALLSACESGRCTAFVAGHTIPTLAYLLSKHADAGTARSALAGLLRLVEVVPVDRTTIEEALAFDFKDFEDAVQMAAAAAIDADYVATRNVKDFAKGPVAAIAPADLVPLLAWS